MTQPAFLIAFFATLVQCYDYGLFGFSASILAKTFMPVCSDADQMLIFFAVFAIAVLARPLGSIIFGKIADNYGRVVSVKIAASIAAISTTIIGITPDFNHIGWGATIILTCCRMAFLMSLAGEVDSTRIYVAEKTGYSHRNLANGLVSFFSQSGALIAAASYHYALGVEISYLWRVNFIIGGFLGLLVIFMRGYFQESEQFLRYKAKHKTPSSRGLLEIINLHCKKFILAAFISGSAGGVYHFLIIFFATFSSTALNLITKDQARFLNIILITVYASVAILSGFLADKFNAKKQIVIALVASLLVALISQIIADKPILLISSMIVLVGFMPFYTIPLQVKTQFMFTIDIRTRMSSISHSIGGMIFSSTTPFFCMLLWKHTESLLLVLGFLMLLLVILLSAAIKILKIKV